MRSLRLAAFAVLLALALATDHMALGSDELSYEQWHGSASLGSCTLRAAPPRPAVLMLDAAPPRPPVFIEQVELSTDERTIETTLSFPITPYRRPVGDVALTATVRTKDGRVSEPVELRGFVPFDLWPQRHPEDYEKGSQVVVKFRQNDLLVRLLRDSEELTLSGPSTGVIPSVTSLITIPNLFDVYRFVRNCAIQHSLPELVSPTPAFTSDTADPDACPSDLNLRVGWCMDSKPELRGVTGYKPWYKRYPGLYSPLSWSRKGNQLGADAIESMAALSTYVIHAQNDSEQSGSQGSGVAVGPHTILTNCHVVMWQSLAGTRPATLTPNGRIAYRSTEITSL